MRKKDGDTLAREQFDGLSDDIKDAWGPLRKKVHGK